MSSDLYCLPDVLILQRHEPQPCYCGEPNCVGFLGGKTQTDIAGMDDLYLDGAFMNSLLTVCQHSCFISTGYF